jgi:uncharacterized protein (TIGR03083 family)
MTAGRLSPTRYLELLHSEGERLLVAAENAMDRPVPACEGWTVDDVVFHVGGVYAHKIAALRLGRRPLEGEWDMPSDEATPGDDLVWCHVMLHAIANELAHRPPEQAAWTWWAPDQTVGFWQRRMANETAVHRADVESAVGPITPIDSDLALDGIDELVTVHLPSEAVELSPVVDVVGSAVSVRFADVEVSGDPSDVLLWLWGRLGDDSVVIKGAEAQIASVKAALRAATQ